jgi:hypothetical protein
MNDQGRSASGCGVSYLSGGHTLSALFVGVLIEGEALMAEKSSVGKKLVIGLFTVVLFPTASVILQHCYTPRG